MDYVNSYLNDTLGLLFMFLLFPLLLYITRKNITVKNFLLSLALLLIIAGDSYIPYWQFKYSDIKNTTINIEKHEIRYDKRTLLNKRYKGEFIFITSSDGDKYLLANDKWEDKFKNEDYTDKNISIDYVETTRFTAIKNIKIID